MGRAYAGVLGPVAFLVTMVRGLMHGSAAESTLLAASGALFLFAGLGYVIGRLASWTIYDAVRSKVAAEVSIQQAEKAAGGSRPG